MIHPHQIKNLNNRNNQIQVELIHDNHNHSTSNITSSNNTNENSKLQIQQDSTMDPTLNNNKNQQSEYKRAFIWGKPMVDVPPPQPEPLVSQYQISFGSKNVNAHHHNQNRPQSYHIDHITNNNNNNGGDSGGSTNTTRSPTPGNSLNSSVKAESEINHHQPNFVRVDTTAATNQQQPQPLIAEQLGQGSSVLFSYEPSPRPPSPFDPAKQLSEYHAKFKPFDDYVYVENEGVFKKQTPASKMATTTVANMAGATAASKAWFVEVEERSRQACKYRARSQNGATPVNPDHLWDGVHVKDRNLQALALATRLIIEEKKQEREQNQRNQHQHGTTSAGRRSSRSSSAIPLRNNSAKNSTATTTNQGN